MVGSRALGKGLVYGRDNSQGSRNHVQNPLRSTISPNYLQSVPAGGLIQILIITRTDCFTSVPASRSLSPSAASSPVSVPASFTSWNAVSSPPSLAACPFPNILLSPTVPGLCITPTRALSLAQAAPHPLGIPTPGPNR